MEERNSVKLKKEEFSIKSSLKKSLGKGKMNKIRIEYTPVDRKSTRLNSSHIPLSRMPSSA